MCHNKTKEKLVNYTKLSEQEQQHINNIFNTFYNKYHNTNVIMLQKKLSNIFKMSIQEDVIKDMLQDIYISLLSNHDKLLNMKDEVELLKLYYSFVNSVRVIGNCFSKIKYIMNLNIEDYDIIEEEYQQQYETDNLNFRLSNEERLTAHYVAIGELYEYIFENNDCILAQSLSQAEQEDEMLYKVAVHYAATPNMAFLIKNKDLFGIYSVQKYINQFKNIVANLTKKEPQKHSIYRTSK